MEKRKVLTVGFCLVAILKTYAQIKFEEGYFINDANERIECLIRNLDWKNNPTGFEYKLSLNGDIQKESIATVTEFGISSVIKYVRATVGIDRSSDAIRELGAKREPELQNEELFLKVLIEGSASLFSYESGNLRRFFFSTPDSVVAPLVYKRYLVGSRIVENNFFRQQLFINLKCPAITIKDVENTHYSKSDLIRLFVRYNECRNSEYVNTHAQRRDLFNLSLRSGLNLSDLSIENRQTDFLNIDFNREVGFRFGIEAEFVLPFNKSKWGIIVEPTYQYYRSEMRKETNSVSGGVIVARINYQSIELPMSLRHYFFLNDHSKIFVNAGFVIDFSRRSSVEFIRNDGSEYEALGVSPGSNLAFGIGYRYRNAFSVEIRHQTNREILHDYINWNSHYSTQSLIIGWSIF